MVSSTGSRRYYIRYLQPWNDQRLVDPQLENYWLPVDLYVGDSSSSSAVISLVIIYSDFADSNKWRERWRARRRVKGKRVWEREGEGREARHVRTQKVLMVPKSY